MTSLGSLLLLAAMAADPGPKVEIRRSGSVFFIEGSFEVTAAPSHAWSTLTDYEHIGRFVKEVQKSVVRSRQGDSLVLEQTTRGRAFVFFDDLQVLLEVRERAPDQIQFRDTANKDFVSYRGSWVLTPSESGTKVRYTLRVQPRKPLPSAMKETMRLGAADLLTQVQAEISRRAAQPGAKP